MNSLVVIFLAATVLVIGAALGVYGLRKKLAGAAGPVLFGVVGVILAVALMALRDGHLYEIPETTGLALFLVGVLASFLATLIGIIGFLTTKNRWFGLSVALGLFGVALFNGGVAFFAVFLLYILAWLIILVPVLKLAIEEHPPSHFIIATFALLVVISVSRLVAVSNVISDSYFGFTLFLALLIPEGIAALVLGGATLVRFFQSQYAAYLLSAIFFWFALYVIFAPLPASPTVESALLDSAGVGIPQQSYQSGSLRVRNEIDRGNAKWVMYEWTNTPAADSNSHCAGLSWVEPALVIQGTGWRVTSTFIVCNDPAQSLVVGGGNRDGESVVFGVASHGDHIQVLCGDDNVMDVPIINGAFLATRQSNGYIGIMNAWIVNSP